MNRTLQIVVLVIALALLAPATGLAQWQCLYATYDDGTNGTGHNTPSIGVIAEDMFVALVMNPGTRNFIIPYVGADSANGRVFDYGYGSGTSGVYLAWTNFEFDYVQMLNAAKLVVTYDSTIYVANNDVDHNILVFKFVDDTVKAVSPYKRQITGTRSIFGLAVDAGGYVYVCDDTVSGTTDNIKIYNPIEQWSAIHNDAPIQTVNLPDGVYRGITASPDGSMLFVCDYDTRSIVKYTGSPGSGYTIDEGFSFTLGANDTVPAETTLRPGPINLAYMASNNILFAAVDVHGYSASTHGTYQYGKIYLINPFTGALVSDDSTLSMIDVAQWNFDQTGGYSSRSGGTDPGTASGYTSTFDVALDAGGNLYSQSHFGWTVEKWTYNGSLPIITSVERINQTVPEGFDLKQNYPNPFNPSTTIEFTVERSSAVKLAVYDVLGREVEVLVERSLTPGTYRATFDARMLPSGAYFYSLTADGARMTKKMILAR